MAISKIIFGGEVLIDITDSTITPETLLENIIAYNAKGERIVGTKKDTSSVTVTDDGNGNLKVIGMNASIG